MANVLVPLAQGCEELEAVTIIDLLRRAGVKVVTAGLDSQPVRASRGVILVPDVALDQVLEEDFDMVVLPGGGPGSERLDQDPRVRGLLQRMAADAKYTAAICAAPKVLANAGVLTGRQATGYPGILESMGLEAVELRTEPVVRDGTVITSRGPGTAMDFALHLIEVLEGEDKRDEVEAALVRP